MPLKTICTLLLILIWVQVLSQGLTCAESDPFCTGTIYEFPAGTSGDAESGPYYGCLGSQPAPAWYHMKIGNPGPITIYMHSIPQEDIDFACWGPFTDPSSACPNGLTQSKMVDCCYCTSWQEYCDIPNGQTGEYYILLITNYSEDPCNIIFSQTAGTGSTDCSILPPLVSNNGPLCVGETLQLHAETIANATYSWTGPLGFSSTVQDPSIPNVTLAHAGEYACVITVFSQVSPPALTEVVIYDLPDAGFEESDTTVCPGEDVFMPVSLTGAGPFEVIYYNGFAYITVQDLIGPLDSIWVNPPGPATYTLTQVSDTNCTKTLTGQTFQVYNFPPASGSISGGGTICEGDTSELVFNLNGTAPWTITYLINGSNPQTITAGYTPFTVPVWPASTTQYQFTQLYDAHCIGTASGQVMVTIDSPSGFLAGDNTICSGETTPLLFTLFGYPPWTLTYTANGTNEQTVIATYSPYSVMVSPTENTLYEFTALSDGYCTGTAEGQAMITIHQPSGLLSGSDTVCAGNPGFITFSLNGEPPWTIFYSANGGNPQTVTAYTSPFNVSLTPSSTTAYQFTSFEDNTCPGIPSGEARITVLPNPAASAGPDKTIANGTSTTLDGTVTGGSGSYTYHWEPADKLQNAGVLQPSTVNLFFTTQFTLTVTDNNGGCFQTDEMIVTISGGVLSSMVTVDPQVICRGVTSQLQALASGGSGSYSYLWSSNPPGYFSDIANPVVSPDATTTYYVSVNDGYNNSEADNYVMVNQLPVPNAGADKTIPYGTPVGLQGNATSGSGSYNFHWEPANLLNNPNISNPVTVQLNETTPFYLNVTDAQTGCTCTEPDMMVVIIDGSALNVNAVAQPSEICAGDSTLIKAYTGGGTGNYSFSWTSDPPGDPPVISSEPEFYVKPLSSTVYFVDVWDGYNPANGIIGVTVDQNPQILIGSDTVVCVFDTLTLDAGPGNEGSSFIWSNGSADSKISIGATGIGYESKIVSVTVTSPEGCITSASKSVTFDFTACFGIEDNPDAGLFRIFPNPGNGRINIDKKEETEILSLSVYDFTGKTVLTFNGNEIPDKSAQFTIDLTTLPEGLYLIRITDAKTTVLFKYLLSD